MPRIAPELLSTASQSPYRVAFERGYGWLRFEPTLERVYRDFHTEAHLLRIRLAGYLAVLLFAAFVLIDFSTLPYAIATHTSGIRAGLIAVFAIGIWLTYQPHLRRAYRVAQFALSVAGGLGTVAIIGVALTLGHPIPYEGILLVPLFVYLIICLPWWQALVANGITLASFIVMELAFQPDPQARMYQVIFMCAANAIAAYGGYFLEYTTRSNFLVHALLNELAERDGLTGLYNRRSLNSHLERTWRQGTRDSREVAVAMIDVDYFKQYNDRFGHAAGDIALKAVADVVASMARRPLDLAARYGGEEFVLVWYHPLPGELQHMGEQLRSAIAALGLPNSDSEHRQLSVSIGIACALPGPGRHWAELLQHADGALFQAKAEGRNRVVALANCGELTGQLPIHEARRKLQP